MAKKEELEVAEPKKSKMPLFIAGGVGLVALIAVVAVMMIKKDPKEAVVVEPPLAEYVVPGKIYQLKDGSYLKLGFSIVTTESKIEVLKELLEHEAPGRLPDGLNMVLGNKTRDDLMTGSNKREAFAMEIKKVIEERVVAEHNRKKSASEGAIEVKEVLLSEFVSQSS